MTKRERELLTDAMIMLEEIKRNRNMPPFAQAQNQYIALGREIRKYLEEYDANHQ